MQTLLCAQTGLLWGCGGGEVFVDHPERALAACSTAWLCRADSPLLLLSTACAHLLCCRDRSSFHQGQVCSPNWCQTPLPLLGAFLISKQKAACWPNSPGRAELGSGSSPHSEQFNSSRRGWGINSCYCHPFWVQLWVCAAAVNCDLLGRGSRGWQGDEQLPPSCALRAA